jgi:hypothetical protein
MVEQGKVSGFRLPPETIDQLDRMIEKGQIQNRTEGVIKGVSMLHTAKLYLGPIHDLIYRVTESEALIRDWDSFQDGTVIPFYGPYGAKAMITKINTQHIKVVQDYGEGEVITDEIKVENTDFGAVTTRKHDDPYDEEKKKQTTVPKPPKK